MINEQSVSTPLLREKKRRSRETVQVSTRHALASENSRHEKHVLHDVMEMSQTQHDSQNSHTHFCITEKEIYF